METILEGWPHIEKAAIERFLKQIRPRAYFLDFEAYCSQDTMGMVKIVRALQELCSQ